MLRFIYDPLDALLGPRDILIPPYILRVQVGPFASARRYKAVGDEFLQYLKALCSLKPDENILDVGCGCGQVAGPLTRYLQPHAIYEGFDISKPMIAWCRQNISLRYPNFNFQSADVYHKIFSPQGKSMAEQYRFPYLDSYFGLVFVKSVFIHMLPEGLENYLSEVYRVLKNNGRCLLSYFLLNTESANLIESGLSTMDFKYIFGKHRIEDKSMPERAIAYDEQYLRHLYDRVGLKITGPLHYGSWCGRENFLDYQDIIIATKPG